MSPSVTFKLFHAVASVVRHCRAVVCVQLALLALAFLVSSCASYPGENLLRLTESKSALDESRTISKAQSAIVELLDHLDISENRRSAFEKISLKNVIRDDQYTKLSNIQDTLVVASGDIDIVSASNSVIVAKGVTHISFSSNNVVVVADNLDVSHDGSTGNGSMLIAKGTIKVSHARNSIVSSPKGVNMSHARGVVAYNTPNRKTSWGQINNLIVTPLFLEEKRPKESESVLTLKTDAEDKFAHEIAELVQKLGSPSPETSDNAQHKLTAIAKTVGNQLEGASKSSSPQVAYRAQAVLNEFRTPKWPDAEVHMVCLYESHSRKVIVEVQKTKKPVILVVCAYEGIVWDIRASDGVEIVQVIASGYHRQRVEGTPAPVATYSYDERSPLYFYTYSNRMPTDPKVIEKVRQLTGKEIFSYQGRYRYDNTPFVVGAKGIRGNECQATVFEIAGHSIYIDCAKLNKRLPKLPNVGSDTQAINKKIRDHIFYVSRHPFRPGTRLTVVFRRPGNPGGNRQSDKSHIERYTPCSLLLDTFVSRYGKTEHLYRDTEGGNNDWYYIWQRDSASLKLACIGLGNKRYARYAEIVLTPTKKPTTTNK